MICFSAVDLRNAVDNKIAFVIKIIFMVYFNLHLTILLL